MQDGYAFTPGRSSKRAGELLAAADEAGIDQTLIRASMNPTGYYIPEELADFLEDKPKGKKKEDDAEALVKESPEETPVEEAPEGGAPAEGSPEDVPPIKEEPPAKPASKKSNTKKKPGGN